MKTRILAIVLATLMLMTAFISCKKDENKEDDGPITIYTLNGTTGFGMAKLMNDNKDGAKYEISVKTDAADGRSEKSSCDH